MAYIIVDLDGGRYSPRQWDTEEAAEAAREYLASIQPWVILQIETIQGDK